MKRVMQASIAVFSHCVAGLDLQTDALLESLFAFLVGAFDVFESEIRGFFDCSCEFKAMECLYLVFYHCLEVRDGSTPYLGEKSAGIEAFLGRHPSSGNWGNEE